MRAFSFFLTLLLSFSGFGQDLKLMHPMHPVVDFSEGDVALSPNGKIIGIASRTGVRLHDAVSGKLLNMVDVYFAHSISFSPDGQQIAFSYQNSIQILDLESDEIIGQYEADSPCFSVTYSPVSKEIAFYSGAQLKIWNFITGKSWVLEDSKHAHHCRLQGVVESDDIQYTPDGKYLLTIPNKTCSTGVTAKLFDIRMKALVKHYDISEYSFFGMHPNGDELVILSSDNKLLLKDFKTLAQKRAIQLSGSYEALKYIPGTNKVLVTNLGQYSNAPVFIVDLLTEEIRRKPSLKATKMLVLNSGKVLTNRLDVYDMNSGESEAFLKTDVYDVERVFFSEDFKKFIIRPRGKDIRLMDDGFNHLVTFPASFYKSYDAVAMPANKDFTVTCAASDVYLWNNATGEVMKKYSGLLEAYYRKEISKDGQFLFQFDRGGEGFSCFSLTDGAELFSHQPASYQMGGNYSGAFSPDNEYFIFGRRCSYDCDARVEPSETEQKLAVGIWSLSFHNQIRQFPTPHPEGIIQNIEFSPDGNYIFTDSNNEPLIYIWDLMGTALKHFEGWISSLSYDGQFLVAFNNIGADFSTIVYNVRTGKKVQSIPVGGRAFVTRDNRHLISVRASRLEVWELSTGLLKFTYYLAGTSDWVALTPEGDYDGTPDGLKEIHYSDGFRVYPLNWENDKHYKPGLIQNILKL